MVNSLIASGNIWKVLRNLGRYLHETSSPGAENGCLSINYSLGSDSVNPLCRLMDRYSHTFDDPLSL